jgi:hypothetical protein
VAIAFRADLQPFLAEFIEHHRGLRMGRMFGLPAGYAGRKMFVCLIEDGLIVKLPQGRFTPIFEMAARHVAEAA